MGTDFFFGAMSPYSWFAAERIDDLLAGTRWRPVFAGGLFRATGRTSWGLTDRRAAGIADCEARAGAHGLGPLRWPDPWPTNDIVVARAMIAAEQCGRLREFALAAMRRAFLEGVDLGEVGVIEETWRSVGLGDEDLHGWLEDPEIKSRLREETDAALSLGVFGVPTVVVAGAVFWGDDRLEEAADYARTATGG